MRVILADATLFLQHLEDGRGHGGCLRIEGEFLENTRHQRLNGFQQRPSRREVGLCVRSEFAFGTNVGRFEEIDIRVEPNRARAVGQHSAHAFPVP